MAPPTVVSSIEDLLQRKADLLKEVSDIDAELERAALALKGVKTLGDRPVKRRRVEIASRGSIPNAIVDALAVREPRTVDDIAKSIGASVPAVSTNCRNMALAGRLFRARTWFGRGHQYLYARSASALSAVPAADETQESQPQAEGEASADAG